ncbi:MAG: hypothetical protein AAGF53_02510 [Pseudomonadota bacterium]
MNEVPAAIPDANPATGVDTPELEAAAAAVAAAVVAKQLEISLALVEEQAIKSKAGQVLSPQ